LDQLLIRELLARYKLEPSVRDVFVEGKFDRDILRWYLRIAGLTNVSVQRTDLIHIPAELVISHVLNTGEKGRVVALARELESGMGNAKKCASVTCVVDADCDRILGRELDCDLLFLTDYTCFEMYFADELNMSKFFQIVLGMEGEPVVAKLLEQYAAILRELFLIRAACEALNLAVGWIDFTSFCKRSQGELIFYKVEFVRHLLQASSLFDKRDGLMSKAEELRPQLQSDIRHSMNGHDFVALLSFDNRGLANKRGLRSNDAIAASMRAGLEFGQLKQESLFKMIETRVAS